MRGEGLTEIGVHLKTYILRGEWRVNRIVTVSAFIIEDGGWVKMVDSGVKLTYFSSNFVFLLANNNSDDNR